MDKKRKTVFLIISIVLFSLAVLSGPVAIILFLAFSFMQNYGAYGDYKIVWIVYLAFIFPISSLIFSFLTLKKYPFTFINIFPGVIGISFIFFFVVVMIKPLHMASAFTPNYTANLLLDFCVDSNVYHYSSEDYICVDYKKIDGSFSMGSIKENEREMFQNELPWRGYLSSSAMNNVPNTIKNSLDSYNYICYYSVNSNTFNPKIVEDDYNYYLLTYRIADGRYNIYKSF